MFMLPMEKAINIKFLFNQTCTHGRAFLNYIFCIVFSKRFLYEILLHRNFEMKNIVIVSHV
jgi:hypothetical protein